MVWLVVILFTLLAKTKSENQTCKVIGETGFMEFAKEGDFIIGAVFAMSGAVTLMDNGYQALPYTYCKK